VFRTINEPSGKKHVIVEQGKINLHPTLRSSFR